MHYTLEEGTSDNQIRLAALFRTLSLLIKSKANFLVVYALYIYITNICVQDKVILPQVTVSIAKLLKS